MYEKDITLYGLEDRINYIQAKLAHLKLSKGVLRDILNAEMECIECVLLSGNDMSMGKLGKFKMEYKYPTLRRVMIHPEYGEIVIPAHEESNKVMFRTKITLKNKIKEKYYGNAFTRKSYHNSLGKALHDETDEEDFEYGSEDESK